MVNIYEVPCMRIWQGYKTYAKACAVMRRGYELTGMCRSLSDKAYADGNDNLQVGEIFSFRGESVLEHQAKTAWLTIAFANNLRTYFGLGPATVSEAERLAETLAIVSVALCHDIGETEIRDFFAYH